MEEREVPEHNGTSRDRESMACGRRAWRCRTSDTQGRAGAGVGGRGGLRFNLVGRDILARIRPDQKAVNVGKISGHHLIPQEEINQILVGREARQGKKVVRLKGGDPFLFGRGGEELLKLKEAGIPFEVIPGGDVRPGCSGLCRNSGDSPGLCFLSSYRDRA